MADEHSRSRMIEDISNLLREKQLPEDARCAGLALIGWLARRMPGEAAHALGVEEAKRQSEARLKVVGGQRGRRAR